MKSQSTFCFLRLLAIVTGGMLMHNACQEKAEVSPPIIQFTETVLSVTEGDNAAIILTLDKPAPENRSMEIFLETNAIYNQHYTTNPAVNGGFIVVALRKGLKSATVTLKTMENAKFEGPLYMVFQLRNDTDEFRLGTITVLTLVIDDDEGPSVTNFALSSAVANEKDAGDGFVVEIPFSQPAKGEGSLTVALQPGKALLGTNFNIDRQLTDNTLSFNVAKNSTGVTFSVFPIDNDRFTGNFILGFTIVDASGVLQKGSGATFSLTVVDDEAPSIAKFALLSGSVSESNSEGIIIEIPLSSPVKGEGTLEVSLFSRNAVYGPDFVTAPDLQNNHVVLNLSLDQTTANFTVLPVDDNLPGDDHILSFSIREAGGVVWKGSDSLTYELIIVDDDP